MCTNNGTAEKPKINLYITDIRLRFVENGRDGLLAWGSCVVNSAIQLSNIALRRDQEGRLKLTYPAKKTPSGVRYYFFNPINVEASEIFEKAVFGALREIITHDSTTPIRKSE